MSSDQAQRKASERARKRALGLKRHEWWLKPAPPGQHWVPKLYWHNGAKKAQR